MMAAPRLGRSPTCLNCLRQLTQPRKTTAPVSLIQTRSRTTKAELEDLQGIPVRLLEDIPSFGRKDAIIRVKPGRMRNYWFPKNQAEYMTRIRFKELGLTDAAIGVRDRSFGSRLVADEERKAAKEAKAKAKAQAKIQRAAPVKPVVEKKAPIPLMTGQEARKVLDYILSPSLTFYRKPNPAASRAAPKPDAAPAPADGATESEATTPSEQPAEQPAEKPAAAPPQGPVPIFGSVSRHDIYTIIKEALKVDEKSSRIVFHEDHVQIMGLSWDEDRIKHLGVYDITITLARDVDPIWRLVEVLPSDG